MNKILNYKLENIDRQTIEIPLPERILSVIEHNNDIVLRYIADDNKNVPKISLDILVIGTGEVVEDNIGIYTSLGTVKLFDGKEIWDVFYRYNDSFRVFDQPDKLKEPIIEGFDRENPGKGGILVS